jgi:hypothetical protein
MHMSISKHLEVYEMKVTIERKDGDSWRQVQADLLHTKNNNCAVKHDGGILVFPNLKEGAEVVGLAGGKWTRCGRVTRGLIFLGEGLSYSEMNEELFKGKKLEEIMVKF